MHFIALLIDRYAGNVEVRYKCKTTIRNNVKQIVHFLLNYMYYMEDVASVGT